MLQNHSTDRTGNVTGRAAPPATKMIAGDMNRLTEARAHLVLETGLPIPAEEAAETPINQSINGQLTSLHIANVHPALTDISLGNLET